MKLKYGPHYGIDADFYCMVYATLRTCPAVQKRALELCAEIAGDHAAALHECVTTGESLPDVYILSQIAELYGVSVSALIGEIQPPKESKPHYHIFILLLSLALTMAVATLLFSMFMICKVDYPAWMFFVYALPVCSIICIVFTSLWWGILWQGVSVSALIWTLGLSLYLSFELENVSLIFLVCAALQVLTLLWEGFRKFLQRSRGLPDGGTKPVSRSE